MISQNECTINIIISSTSTSTSILQSSSVQFSPVQFNMNTQPIVNQEIKNPFSMKGNLSDFKKAFPGISNLDEAYVAPVVPPVRRRVIKQKTT